MNHLHAGARQRREVAEPDRRRGPTASPWIVVVSIVGVVAVAATAGLFAYRDWVAPFNTVVVEVNDVQIKMRYFLKRVAMSNEPATNMLEVLAREQMIGQAAEAHPFNIKVTAEDVDRFARKVATGGDSTIEEGEFREWYRQQLNETRLSEAEYRDLLRAGLLSERMTEHLKQRVPTVAEQVFVNVIAVAGMSTAEAVKRKYEAGDDFAALAREYSAQPQLAEAGGRIGWIPRGVIDPRLEAIAFDLEIGRLSDPLALDGQNLIVMMVSERSAAREIDEQSLSVLRSRVLEHWYDEAFKDFSVGFHGFNNGYDSETNAWVNWQLTRMQRKRKGDGVR